jgi:hypothetical protein
VFATIVDAQASLGAWVEHYNTVRPHRSLGMASPVERFRLAQPRAHVVGAAEKAPVVPAPAVRPAGVTRWVDQRGAISLAGARYRVGPVFAGEPVEALCRGGLVEVLHAGVLVATHAERRRAGQARKQPAAVARLRDATVGVTVTRRADGNGADPAAARQPGEGFNLSGRSRSQPVSRVPGLDRSIA